MYDINIIQQKAKYCRAFEISVFEQIKKGNIKIPVYLSAGQEYIAATIGTYCSFLSSRIQIFAQHRCHSIYLSFGGDTELLIRELLGLPTGCANGMGGSASIHFHNTSTSMYGHDGMMGSNIPIGVGACYASKIPTIIFAGDAAAEEDYALTSYGWAGTKNLPILFVIEDNNLSILTEKKIRRSWEIYKIAEAMNIESYNITDNPIDIMGACYGLFYKPKLLNINTVRKFWHSGAGIDGIENKDELDNCEEELEGINKIWKQVLETQ